MKRGLVLSLNLHTLILQVQKRNGRIEPLDISKIQKYTSSAVKGLDNVSQSELEVDAKIQFRDKITTEEIQKTLIKTAVDKIDIDRPNWTYVAARLFLYDLYHKVNAFTGYGSFSEYLERGEKEGRIVLGLKEKYDLRNQRYPCAMVLNRQQSLLCVFQADQLQRQYRW